MERGSEIKWTKILKKKWIFGLQSTCSKTISKVKELLRVIITRSYCISMSVISICCRTVCWVFKIHYNTVLGNVFFFKNLQYSPDRSHKDYWLFQLFNNYTFLRRRELWTIKIFARHLRLITLIKLHLKLYMFSVKNSCCKIQVQIFKACLVRRYS